MDHRVKTVFLAEKRRNDLELCREKAGEEWDEEEIYFVVDELRQAFPTMKFEQISIVPACCLYRDNIWFVNWITLRKTGIKKYLWLLGRPYPQGKVLDVICYPNVI